MRVFLVCSKQDKTAFSEIATCLKDKIIHVIKNGSQGSWQGFKSIPMPAYDDTLDDQTIEILADWIKKL